ncbi:sensor histidine kinase [Maribacter sp. 2307ULW6-5]|uniref:sensor histidine kinase n=1 Tax=Maribacter sp. 2307ULW6-5 TaxID=3386275 RepID=UPI0039BD7D2B
MHLQQLEKDKIIERQLRFQELLMAISTKYINSDLSDIDRLVNGSLKQIGEFVGADRSYIFSYDFVNHTTSNTYEWCAEGIKPELDNLQQVPTEFIPQWLEAHRKGQAFYVENVAHLPEDGEHGLRAILEPQGIKSLITIPKIKNNELIGFIGFDSVRKINAYSENEKEILFVFANMLVNVIQRKENEEYIQAQERKKEELLSSLSRQNEELSEYAHVVSHDLKSPITNIHTLVSWFMADQKDKLTPEELRPLGLVLFNVEKMDSLIKGMLDYSTIGRVRSEEQVLDCNVLVQEVLEAITLPGETTISVEDNLPCITGNPWHVKQVFNHLIGNAITFSTSEKVVVHIGCTARDRYFEFFVRDNGMGIEKKYFDRIFKVFHKLDADSTSSGVGLSIVKRIIDVYQGAVWLESEPGVGSTFYFTLPKPKDKDGE